MFKVGDKVILRDLHYYNTGTESDCFRWFNDTWHTAPGQVFRFVIQVKMDAVVLENGMQFNERDLEHFELSFSEKVLQCL